MASPLAGVAGLGPAAASLSLAPGPLPPSSDTSASLLPPSSASSSPAPPPPPPPPTPTHAVTPPRPRASHRFSGCLGALGLDPIWCSSVLAPRVPCRCSGYRDYSRPCS
uniref:Uncharacterized protein n=1 Tax=Oryza nivara TaxID=4536 RepID=A0A0E0JAM7_ORYNI